MCKAIKNLIGDQDGNIFVEAALVIILLVLAIAPYISSLGSETGIKLGEMRDRVSQVGN